MRDHFSISHEGWDLYKIDLSSVIYCVGQFPTACTSESATMHWLLIARNNRLFTVNENITTILLLYMWFEKQFPVLLHHSLRYANTFRTNCS